MLVSYSSIAGGPAVFLPCFLSGLFYLVNGKLDILENMDSWGCSTSFDGTVYAGISPVSKPDAIR